MADTNDARQDLASMLRAKGADDEAVASMLGLVDEQSAKLAAADRARDDALGFVVYDAIHGIDGNDLSESWGRCIDDERASYIAAAKAVKKKLDDEYDRDTEALQNDLEEAEQNRELLLDTLYEIERCVSRGIGGGS